MFDRRLIFFAEGYPGRVFAAVGIAGTLLMTFAGSADAQFFGWFTPPPPAYSSVPPRAMISPRDIGRIVADDGYRLRRLQRNGRVYLADVLDHGGRRLRLVIDAYQGDILQRFWTASRRAASVPPPQSRPSGYQQYSAYPSYPGYPAYPQSAAPAAPRVAPRIERKVDKNARRNGPEHKKEVASREAVPRQIGHQTAVPPRPAAQVEPAKAPGAVKSAAKPEPVTAAVAPAAHASSPKPAPPPKTTGPGYANGVPINPLD